MGADRTGSIDERINSLSGVVDETLRKELTDALRTLRIAENPVAVLASMSRLSLHLVRVLFDFADQELPSDNLYECIEQGASLPGDRDHKGRPLLPQELRSALHTVRVLSNKADHAAENVHLTVSDAENALNLYVRVLEWVYCEYAYGPRISDIYNGPDPVARAPAVSGGDTGENKDVRGTAGGTSEDAGDVTFHGAFSEFRAAVAKLRRTNQVTGIALVSAATLMWAGVNVIIKHLVTARIHPIVVSCGLYVSALTTLVPIYYLLRETTTRATSSLLSRPWPSAKIWLAKAAETLCFVYAVKFITATEATTLSKSNAFWTFAILFVFYRREVGGWSFVGSLVTFLGVYVLVGGLGGLTALTVERGWGVGLALASGMAMAVFSVGLNKDPRAPDDQAIPEKIRYTALIILAVSLFLLIPSAIVWSGHLPPWSDIAWLWIAGGIGIGAVYYLYYLALRRISSLLGVAIVSLTIPATLVLENIFFDVALGPPFIVGALLIICGVISVSKGVQDFDDTKFVSEQQPA